MPLYALSKHQSIGIGGKHSETVQVVYARHSSETQKCRDKFLGTLRTCVRPCLTSLLCRRVCILRVRPAHIHVVTCLLTPPVLRHTHGHVAVCSKPCRPGDTARRAPAKSACRLWHPVLRVRVAEFYPLTTGRRANCPKH